MVITKSDIEMMALCIVDIFVTNPLVKMTIMLKMSIVTTQF